LIKIFKLNPLEIPHSKCARCAHSHLYMSPKKRYFTKTIFFFTRIRFKIMRIFSCGALNESERKLAVGISSSPALHHAHVYWAKGFWVSQNTRVRSAQAPKLGRRLIHRGRLRVAARLETDTPTWPHLRQWPSGPAPVAEEQRPFPQVGPPPFDAAHGKQRKIQVYSSRPTTQKRAQR
jgi:hypothetical protein